MSKDHVEAALLIELRAASKSVLMALAYHTNEFNGVAWPGFTRLGKWTGLDERSLRRIIKELETQGLVSVKRGTGRTSSVYTLHLVGAGVNDVTDSKRLPLEALNPGGTESPPSRVQGGQPVRAGRTQSPPRADRESPKTNERKEETSDARVVIDDDWQPSEGIIAKIKLEEGLDADDIEHQRRLFVLKNQESGLEVRFPDAAFRRWCARMKDLNHPPKKVPKKPKLEAPVIDEAYCRKMIADAGTQHMRDLWRAHLVKLQQLNRADA
jgi:DNA-binding MarR family transcriptional regulator